MREIEFRGKRIDNGAFAYGFYFEIEHNDDKTHVHGYITANPLLEKMPESIASFVEVDPTTVAQFTGFCDKNGVKTFGKDIVQMYRYSDDTHKHEKDFISEVKFSYGAFYVVNPKFKLVKTFFHMARPGQSFEVIGNIHEIPSLLKEVNS